MLNCPCPHVRPLPLRLVCVIAGPIGEQRVLAHPGCTCLKILGKCPKWLEKAHRFVQHAYTACMSIYLESTSCREIISAYHEAMIADKHRLLALCPLKSKLCHDIATSLNSHLDN